MTDDSERREEQLRVDDRRLHEQSEAYERRLAEMVVANEQRLDVRLSKLTDAITSLTSETSKLNILWSLVQPLLFGNGKPGLGIRMDRVEQEQLKKESRGKTFMPTLLIIAGGAIVFVANIALRLCGY